MTPLGRQTAPSDQASAQVTIVGLGLIGTALGLALKASGTLNLRIVGHDKEPDASSFALKARAVDRTEWHLIRAVEKADLVVLAVPLAAMRGLFEAIGPVLKPGCVVTDTASTKGAVMQWAAELLPGHVHFVGGDPIVQAGTGGQRAASPSLFQHAMYGIVALPQTSPEAVQVVVDMVESIQAQPLFLDPAEHDGLVAVTTNLPLLLAAALLNTAGQEGTWREVRRLAGGTFDAATQLGSGGADVLTGATAANAGNIVRWLDTYTAQLAAWRAHLLANDQAALSDLFGQALEARAEWLVERSQGFSEALPLHEAPPSNVQRLFGIRRRSPKPDQKG